MHTVLILHGPNLNLLGEREPEIYSSLTLSDLDSQLKKLGEELGLKIRTWQSNTEGTLIEQLHSARKWAEGIVFNPGGYTHTSVALRDAISAIDIPVIEVHLSNVHAREEFRKHSMISPVCLGTITGFGWRSYALALWALAEIFNEQSI